MNWTAEKQYILKVFLSYCNTPLRRLSAVKIKEQKKFFCIIQSQGGNLVDWWDLAPQFINVKETIQEIAPNSFSPPHTAHLSVSYLLSVQTANSVSVHEASTSSSSPSPPTSPCREKGWAQSWLIVSVIMSPQHLTVSTSTIPSINKGVCFPFPLWCVTLCCRFGFNMCDRIHLTGSRKTWGGFFFFFLWRNSSHSIQTSHLNSSVSFWELI